MEGTIRFVHFRAMSAELRDRYCVRVNIYIGGGGRGAVVSQREILTFEGGESIEVLSG